MHPKYIKVGYAPSLLLGTFIVPCKIIEILSINDRRKDWKVITHSPNKIKCNEFAIVKIQTQKKICADTWGLFSQFLLRDGKKFTGWGRITFIQPNI